MSLNLKNFKHFTENQYARHLVIRTDNIEMLVVCWMPGQITALHGHGPTDGIVTVLEGQMQNTNVMPSSDLKEGKKITRVYQAGDILHTPVGVSHRMANTSDAPAMTLHVYAPPLGDEYRNPDLGYANDIDTKEMHLPDEIRRYLMASPTVSGMLETDSYCI